MKHIIYLLGVVWIGIGMPCHAQDAFKNHSKYWFYRYRLLHEFMAKGEAPCGAPSGFSIPASHAYGSVSGNDQVHFGDGTSFLGNYIGVLATEHELLVRTHATETQKQAVRQELYYAMKTYERLDKNAEKLYWDVVPGDCNSMQNGFFTREDVDKDLVKNHFSNLVVDHKAPRFETVQGTVQQENQLRAEGNRFTGREEAEAHCGKSLECASQAFPSTDQISNLFVGFALVNKCMNGYNYNGYDFGTVARQNVQNIHDYLYRNNYDMIYPRYNVGLKYGGIEMQMNAKGLYDAAKAITGDEKAISGAQALADSKIIWDWLNYPSGDFYFDANYYEKSMIFNCDNGVQLCALSFWPDMKDKGAGHVYNNAVTAQLAAIGNLWEVGLVPEKRWEGSAILGWLPCNRLIGCNITKRFGFSWWGLCDYVDQQCQALPFQGALYCYKNNTPGYLLGHLNAPGLNGKMLEFAASVMSNTNFALCAPFKLPSVTVNTTAYALGQYGSRYRIPNFALLNQFLHGTSSLTVDNRALIEEYLNTAPCNGPHGAAYGDPNVNTDFNVASDLGVKGWWADNRFEKANQDAPQSFMGKSNNGLDYMLLFNLYNLKYGGSAYNGYYDMLLSELQGQSYPQNTSNFTTGSDVRPSTMYGFETFTASNITINNGSPTTQENGNVTFRAGISVVMKDEFTVRAGANFCAYIDPKFGINCNYSGGLNYTPRYQTGSRLEETVAEAPSEHHTPSVQVDTMAIVKELYEKYEHAKDAIAAAKDWKYSSVSEFMAANSTDAKIATTYAYPNPSHGKFRLFCEYGEDVQSATIKNVNGQLVKTIPVTGSPLDIDLSDLQDGVYFVHIKGVGETVKLLKIAE